MSKLLSSAVILLYLFLTSSKKGNLFLNQMLTRQVYNLFQDLWNKSLVPSALPNLLQNLWKQNRSNLAWFPCCMDSFFLFCVLEVHFRGWGDQNHRTDFFLIWTSHSGKSSFLITIYHLYFSQTMLLYPK